MRRTTLDTLIEETIDELDGNLSKVARQLGLPYHTLVAKYGPKAVGVLPPACPRPDDIKDLGRDHVREYVIAIKRCGHDWPVEFVDVLKDARRKFDHGTHEMFQSVDKGWVVQYLIPRRTPTYPRRFFHHG